MNLTGISNIKKSLSVALLGLSLAIATPTAAPAQGLGDLLFGPNISTGCTQFISPYGHPVTVKYYTPKANCPSPAVILLHGIDGGSRYQAQYDEIGRSLAAKGYASFIVYYYEGQPLAPRPGPYDRGLPDPHAFAPWVDTVRASVEFVQAFPGVDPHRVGLMGMSLGGYVGSSAASNNPRVKSLVVLSGGMPDIYAANSNHMPRTLIVHGQQDADVPVWEALKLRDTIASRGQWHRLLVLPCEGHLPFRDKNYVAEQVLRFLDSNL